MPEKRIIMEGIFYLQKELSLSRLQARFLQRIEVPLLNVYKLNNYYLIIHIEITILICMELTFFNEFQIISL